MSKWTIGYLNLYGRPSFAARALSSAMRSGEAADCMSANFEPGDEIPSRRDLSRLMRRIEAQELLVAVAIWTLENESWLRHCGLRLKVQSPGRAVALEAVHWQSKVDKGRFLAARRALVEICTLLTPNISDGYTRELQRAVVCAMNACGWLPCRVSEVLGALASPSKPDVGEAWLERHVRAFEAEALRDRTEHASVFQLPRRL